MVSAADITLMGVPLEWHMVGLLSDYLQRESRFWFQSARPLPCACAFVALFAQRLAYNHYASARANNAPNAHGQGSGRVR